MHSTTARPGHRPGDAPTTITMMVSLNTKKQQTTNERLRAMVEASGLTQAEALALFNKPLGPAGYSLDYWKGFFCDSASKRFKPLRTPSTGAR